MDFCFTFALIFCGTTDINMSLFKPKRKADLETDTFRSDE